MTTAKFAALCAVAFTISYSVVAGPRAEPAPNPEIAAREANISAIVKRQMSDPCENLSLPALPGRNCSGHSEPTTIVIKVQ